MKTFLKTVKCEMATLVNRLRFALLPLCVCGLALGVGTACAQENALPLGGASVNDTLPAYPRCQTARGCVDLSNALNPSENDAKDYQATPVPLRWQGHAATAFILPASLHFNDIAVSPSGKLYAVGGWGVAAAVFATNDGSSNTWHVAKQYDAGPLMSIASVTDTRAYAVGSKRILRTQDSGAHWEPFNLTFPSREDPNYQQLLFGAQTDWVSVFNNIAFADAAHGIMVGQLAMNLADFLADKIDHEAEPGILRTSDGGQRWQWVAERPALKDAGLTRVTFSNPQTAWAVGANGTVLRTDDAGARWVAVPLNDTSIVLTGVSFSSPEHGCIAGGRTVWCTWDGGQHWQTQTITGMPPPRDQVSPRSGLKVRDDDIANLLMTSARQGWLITKNGLIFHSQDDGRNWSLWMDAAQAASPKLNWVDLWGLTSGHDRILASGRSYATPDSSESALVLSWPAESTP